MPPLARVQLVMAEWPDLYYIIGERQTFWTCSHRDIIYIVDRIRYIVDVCLQNGIVEAG